MSTMFNEKSSDPGHVEIESISVKKRHPSKIANPAPAGLFGFAATTFLISMYNVNTRGIHHTDAVVGMAIFTGGLVQFMAGMWEFPRGNAFGATAFSTYGSFGMAYATIYIPGSGIIAAYSDPQELANAIGMFLVVWFMFSTLLVIVVIRRNTSLAVVLSLLAMTYILLASAQFTNSPSLTKAGGIVGIITALGAYYVAMSELLGVEAKPVVRLPQGVWYHNE